MGCLCATLATRTPPRDFDKRGHHVHGTHGFKDVDKVLIREEHAKNLSAIGNSKITREGEKQGVIVSRRITEKKIESDESVDGWPKWLVDNVLRSVLSGLTKKTADSYDKIAKVGHGTYSNVYKARDRDTGKIVALKKETEKHLSEMVVSKALAAKIDRPVGIISFQSAKDSNDILNSWATNLEKLLDLVEKSCHQIHKEMMVHKTALKV